MGHISNIILSFILGFGFGAMSIKHLILNGFTVSDIAQVGTFFIGIFGLLGIFIGYRHWRIDKIMQLHINLRDLRSSILKEIDKLSDTDIDNKNILYCDFLNELELIAKMVSDKIIDEKWAKDFFKT